MSTATVPTSVQDAALRTIDALGRRMVEHRTKERQDVAAAILNAEASGFDFCEIRTAFASAGVDFPTLLAALDV